MNTKFIKIITIVLAIVFTLGLVYLGLSKEANQVYSMKVDNLEKKLVELEAEQEVLDHEISRLYADSNHTYVIESVTEEAIDEVEKNLVYFDEHTAGFKEELTHLTARDQKKYTDKMKEREIEELLETYYINIEDLKIKKEITDLINSLFSVDYIKNAEIDKDAYISSELDTEKFETVNTLIAQEIEAHILVNGEEYSASVNQGLVIAQKQLIDFNRAVDLRDELFNDNGVLIQTDSEKVQEFLLALEVIKNPEIQRTFEAYVSIIEEYDNLAEEETDLSNTEEPEVSRDERQTSEGQSVNNSGSQTGQTTNKRNPVSNREDTEPASKPELKPEPKLEPKPEPKPEPTPEPKPEPEAVPEPKPEPKPEAEPKPELKPDDP